MKSLHAFITALLLLPSVHAAAKTYEIPEVADFTELVVADPVNVVYSTAPGGATAVVSGPDATVSYVIVESAKGKMTIRLSDDGLNARDLPTVTVTSAKLVKAQNNTDSTLTVNLRPAERLDKFNGRLEGNGVLTITGIDATEVSLKKFTGRGVITASGSCGVLSVNNTGTGSINCADLTAREAKCKVVGTGSIYVHVTEQLSVTGVSGTVYYTGTPAEIKSRTLGVKLRPIEQQPAD